MRVNSKKAKYAGTTLSYQLYRIGEWLWNLEIRGLFNKIVDYVAQISGNIDDEGPRIRIVMNTIFGEQLSDEKFKYVLKRLKDLERIKKTDVQILVQLRAFGDNIENYRETEGFVFTAHKRPWHHAGEMVMATNFVLAVPSLSRVVSYETSEDIQTLNQFLNVQIKNTQFYSMFNKLKAVRGRNTRYSSGSFSISDLGFLFRTTSDLKMIHRFPKIHLFTFTPTTGEEAKKFQVANYFILLGKISQFNATDLSGKKSIQIHDYFGTLDMMIDDKEIIHANKSPLIQNAYEYFGLEKTKCDEVSLSYDGYALFFGYWSMDDEHPWIFHMVPLGNLIPKEKIKEFDILAYVNVRKKVNRFILEKLFPSFNKTQKEVFTYGKWTYLVEKNWDLNKFTKSTELEKHEFKNSLRNFLGINEIFVPIYQSETPEIEFAEFYRLPKERTCPTCGSELFEITNFVIESHIRNNSGKFSTEYQSIFSHDQEIMKSVELNKNKLTEIVSSNNKSNAASFVQKYIEYGRVCFSGMNEMDICKNLHKIFCSIRDVVKRRIFFEFSENMDGETILGFLQAEHPQKIHINSSSMLYEIHSGKNCIIHGSLNTNVSEHKTGLISRILEISAKEEFDNNQRVLLSSVAKKISDFCRRWHNIVEDAIKNNIIFSQQKIEEITKQWNDYCSEISDDVFSNFEGTGVGISKIKQLKVNDTQFFIFCYLVTKMELHSAKDWKNLLDKMQESELLLKSNVAMQTGNISDMNLVLRIIAYRFLDFHYKDVLRIKNPFDSKVLENSLRMQMEPITFSDKKNSNRFPHLGSISFQTRTFRNMCKMLLAGEIRDLKQADRFLGNYSWRDEGTKFKGMQQRKPFINQKRAEPRQLMSQSSQSKIQHAPNIQFNRKEKTPLKDTDLGNRLEKIGFQNGLEELSREWKRVSDAKSHTHAPKIYQESKNSFQPKFQSFINHYCKTCPEISSLRGKSIESKEIKNFFSMISQKGEFTQEAIAKMMGKA